MRSSIPRRLASLVLALALLGATSAIPLLFDADHMVEEPHVDEAHGGHDGILIQHTDDPAVGGKIVLRPVPAACFCLAVPSFNAGAPNNAAKDPPSRPPDYRSPPRAPPALT